MVKRAVLSLALVAALATPVQTQAQSLGVDFTSVTAGYNDGPWAMGFAFTALTDVAVTGLGAFDLGQNGLQRSHRVGLYNSSGSLLASTTVGAGTSSPLMGFFRMASISSVQLTAGNSYTVVGANFGPNSNDQYGWNTTGMTTDSRIQFDGGRYELGSGLVYANRGTNTGDTRNGWFGGNVQLEAVSVPEPGSMALLATGLFGLVGVRRRRQDVTDA